MHSLSIQPDHLPMLEKMSNTIRFLCADMVQSANSGHPGAPMGLADIATVLSFHININPKNPNWINRDRLVFSGGHASALVYSLIHLWGFDITLDDLKSFRKFGSKTPGHPEFGHTQGVEITTGPLGQGVANAVGFAMASKYAQSILGEKVINHKVYCFCGDGDLEEGISYEASSIAGHHRLDNLIMIYDSNAITIEGDLNVAMSEDISRRFDAQGWRVLKCNGHDFISINNAIADARKSDKPTIIIANTTIAKNALGLEGSHKSHGTPLGEEVIRTSKKAFGFDERETFAIADDVAIRFKNVLERGELSEKIWQDSLQESVKQKIYELQHPDFSKIVYPDFSTSTSLATRVSNGKILNAISKALEGFIGGSADLAPSNNTHLEGRGDFPKGKNLHFGIREHAMGAISNALANYGLFLPFCATFFVFSDYMSASIRVASIMKAKLFYIFTHDSIGVGEDGATHQPIEQLTHLRAIPNLYVFRPADAYENIACWKIALGLKSPSAFVLSRQNLPVLRAVQEDKVSRGGYILKDCASAQITLLATGSEVHIALEGAKILEGQGIATRVVSVPCYDLLISQDKEYIRSLFGDTKVLAIEASRGIEWYVFADDVLVMDSFGSSAKGDELFKHYGFSAENIAVRAKALIK
ncbi:transketolase [Helicobacter cappadocius]|uniref:Transketolase n=1 Tax=Helicobacter cappadocius TaxID=3063998 RepID=A0AA90TB41_9HELI|nr:MULTISPECIES: transketolase [unclassified Helicobacter]MDO7252579.1 transketolase [Helicobacter sp. faydin-H75]MDP2538446.1 transketolase [Helicobacter sp. faydin-H76]